MKCAEQVRNVYVRIQMWNTIYCYIISTCDATCSPSLLCRRRHYRSTMSRGNKGGASSGRTDGRQSQSGLHRSLSPSRARSPFVLGFHAVEKPVQVAFVRRTVIGEVLHAF